jgi:hypothetical protein
MLSFCCCNQVMYQEIDFNNILRSECKICGKVTEIDVSQKARKKNKDNVEFFNIKLIER